MITSQGLTDSTAPFMEQLPQHELYSAYSATISTRFPAFGVRPFIDAAKDMSVPFTPYDSKGEISQDLIDLIVTPESHDRFCEDLDRYENNFGLPSWRDHEGTTVYAVDHGQFTDVPITAETHGRVNPNIRERTVQVISKMIATMQLDLGEGEFDVIDKLANISALLQTLPRLEGDASESLTKYRERENGLALGVLGSILDTRGMNVVMSVIGRHNVESKNKRRLYIHEPNRSTIAALVGNQVKVIPLYIHCPTFSPDGSIEPADMQYRFFDPMFITDPKKDTVKIVELFKHATEETIGHEYPSGVHIRSWKAQKGFSAVNRAKQRITHSPDVKSNY